MGPRRTPWLGFLVAGGLSLLAALGALIRGEWWSWLLLVAGIAFLASAAVARAASRRPPDRD